MKNAPVQRVRERFELSLRRQLVPSDLRRGALASVGR